MPDDCIAVVDAMGIKDAGISATFSERVWRNGTSPR